MCEIVGTLPAWEQHLILVIVFAAYAFWEMILGRASWTRAASTLDLLKLGVQRLRGTQTITVPVVKDGEPIAEVKTNGNS